MSQNHSTYHQRTSSIADHSPNSRSPTDKEEQVPTSAFLIRPPTPPKHNSTTENLIIDANTLSCSSGSPLDRDPTSSSPVHGSCGKTRKQVVWDPLTRYYNPEDITLSQHSKGPTTTLRSILKPTTPVKEDVLDLRIGEHNFQSMLESSVTALSSPHRNARIDTYITFSNALRVYDGRPDIKAIKSKMSILTSFIRRDISSRLSDASKDARDSQLIQQALKLLTIFAWSPELVNSIANEDAAFFFQEAIRTIQDCQSPKILVTYFLHFLRQQQFPHRIMTSERANAIISTLNDVDDRGSNNISQERIGIYHRLLTQSRPTMAIRTSDWIDKVLAGLVSSNKETRLRALNCAMESAHTIGSERVVARSLISIFNRGATEGQPFFHRFADQLVDIFKDGEGVFVANVWGVIILLLRARYPVTSWEYFSPWLGTIQLCFNSSTISVKIAANAAWGKLIYALSMGGDAITPKNIDLLTRPLARYLDPLNASLNSKAPRQAAISNVIMLLYYCLRPNIALARIPRLWESLVVTLVDKLVLCGSEEFDEGCQILTALFDGSNHQVWRESRGVEKKAIAPIELPRLDPKWVRANSFLVLKTIRNAITKAAWQKPSDQTIRNLWHHFTRILADAGMKEVKISAELMESIAHILTMILSIWRTGIDAFPAIKDTTPDAFMRIICFILNSTIDNIGPVCFTEKQLVCDSQSTFVFSASSSSKYSFEDSAALTIHAPLVFLFQMFLKPPLDVPVSTEYLCLVDEIFHKCLNGLDSRRKRLTILSSCIPVLPLKDVTVMDMKMWSILASLAVAALNVPLSAVLVAEDEQLRWELRDAVVILRWGCRYNVSNWDELLEQLTWVVSSEQSRESILHLVLGPLADELRLCRTEMDGFLWLQRGRQIINQAALLFDSNEPETIRTLPIQPNNAQKMLTMGSCANIFSLVNQILLDCHSMTCEGSQLVEVKGCIECIERLLLKCPLDLVLDLLCSISEGASIWILETTRNSDATNLISQDITSLWINILSKIDRLPRYDNIILQRLAPILCAGFETENESIVTMTKNSWNKTFGLQSGIEYPKRLKDLIDHSCNLRFVSMSDLIDNSEQATASVAMNSVHGEYYQNDSNIEHTSLLYGIAIQGSKRPSDARDSHSSQSLLLFPPHPQQNIVDGGKKEAIVNLIGTSSSRMNSRRSPNMATLTHGAACQQDIEHNVHVEQMRDTSPERVSGVSDQILLETSRGLSNSDPNGSLDSRDLPYCHQPQNTGDSATKHAKSGEPVRYTTGDQFDDHITSICTTKRNLPSQETPDFENSVEEIPDSFAGQQKKHIVRQSQANFQVVLESKESRAVSVATKDAKVRPGRGRKSKGLHGKLQNSPVRTFGSAYERHYSTDSCDSLLESISVAEPVMSNANPDVFTSSGTEVTPSKRELRKRKLPGNSETNLEDSQGVAWKRTKPSLPDPGSPGILSSSKPTPTDKKGPQSQMIRPNNGFLQHTVTEPAVSIEYQSRDKNLRTLNGPRPESSPREAQSNHLVPSYEENASGRQVNRSHSTSSTHPLANLQQAIQLLESANLSAPGLREAEDMIFDLYSRFRERRRKLENKMF